MTQFDEVTLAGHMARPGNDTRQWCSYGLVKADAEGARSVLFQDEQGNPRPYPVVLVTLQPSGIDVTCRVAAQHGGAGEGSWRPFVAGDEVWVQFAEGDERNAVITGRFPNGLDSFPTVVAGADVTQNNAAFDRHLAPYILESGTAILLRVSSVASFLSLDPTGNVVATSADGHFLALQHDQLTLSTSDLSCMVQVDPSKQTLFLQAGPTQLLLDSGGSSALLTQGGLTITTQGGGYAQGHAVTLEQVVALLQAFLTLAGAAASTPIMLANFFATFAVPGAISTVIAAATTAPGGALTPAVTSAIPLALQVPPDPTGVLPGLGRVGLLI